jgi:hypothetical protein
MFRGITRWIGDRIEESKDEAVLDAAAVKSAAGAAPSPSPEDAMIDRFESETNTMDDERHA